MLALLFCITQLASSCTSVGCCEMKQTDRIIQYMRDFGGITALEAMRDLGVMRLASRINDLKNAGVAVKKTTVHAKNRYGENTAFARYRLGEET